MPVSKHIIIQASAAAVIFTSTLPLGNALEAVALRASDHDFPPLNKTTREDIGDSATVICTFSAGEENSEAWSAVQVLADRSSGIQTSYIACPEIDGRGAFMTTFDVDELTPLVSSYSPRGDYHILFADTPPGAGLDPLEDFHDTTVTELLNVIDPPDRNLFYFHEWQAAGEALKKFCPAVREALERKFGKFTKMCHKYLRVSKAAVKTAEVRGWQFLTRGTSKHVYPPKRTHSSGFFD
ncbi:hypothetical protein FOZ63_016972 [Perkinsus olseni]|uniref:Uncharacterized protein n=1 Tax=Perkinsus olseni TaxID=32597 RepID=A0A7J6NDN7_PEROL|nr:hypothetical protein FOZ63_016972 [Perkinsus olseni]